MTAMTEKATAPHRYTCGEFFGREPPDIGPYISVPKALLDTKDLVYRTLSADAILLYSLLLDLVSLSQKSGWLDEAGRVYIRPRDTANLPRPEDLRHGKPRQDKHDRDDA